jgi:integrase
MWARHLEAAGTPNSTAARKLTAVSSFYAWALRRGHVAANPVAGLDRPAVDYDTSATPGLTRDQAVALLAAADADPGPQAARTAALVATLLFTGARVSELTGADIEDLGTDRGHRVLRVRRKGGKIQALALPAPAAARIEAYLAGRGDVTALPAVPGPAAAAPRRVLFAAGTGARMYRAEVRALLRRLGRAAALPPVLGVGHAAPGEPLQFTGSSGLQPPAAEAFDLLRGLVDVGDHEVEVQPVLASLVFCYPLEADGEAVGGGRQDQELTLANSAVHGRIEHGAPERGQR